MSDLMWIEASRDIESEAAERSLEEAKVVTAGLWPFLAVAKSPHEFEERLDLSLDHLQSVAHATGCDLGQLQDSLRNQHKLVTEAAGWRDDPVEHSGRDYDSDLDADDEGAEDQASAMQQAERMRKMHQNGYDSSIAYSSLHTALEEGQDPLLWIQDASEFGSGPEKPIEHDETSAVTASRETDPKG
jgi:hypothetical protein